MIAIMNQSLELFIKREKPYPVPQELMVTQKEGYLLLIPRQLKLEI